MKVRCVWEHNGSDSLLYADNFIGAFSRGPNLEAAVGKMDREIRSYLKWKGSQVPDAMAIDIVQEKPSELNICDADSDVLFESETGAMPRAEYAELKGLALKSAEDFHALFSSIPDGYRSCLGARKTFYGAVPRTAYEMYEHTKNVNDYYFGEIGVEADHEGTILACRQRGFARLEETPDYLLNRTFEGSYGEAWTLKKVLRRFIWHDRIHAKAMYRMAIRTFGREHIPNLFQFDL